MRLSRVLSNFGGVWLALSAIQGAAAFSWRSIRSERAFRADIHQSWPSYIAFG